GQLARNAFLDRTARAYCVGLEQKAPETPAKLRCSEAFRLLRHQDHANRLTHIRLTLRPRHTPIRPHARWKTYSPSKYLTCVHLKNFSRKGAKAQRKPQRRLLGARQALRLCAFAGENFFMPLPST